MRNDVRILEVKKSVAIGAAQRVHELREAIVQVGTTDGVAPVAVVKVQAQVASESGDFMPNEWIDLATFTNAGGVIALPGGYTRVRCNTTGYTSGNLIAAVSGKNTRTDS